MSVQPTFHIETLSSNQQWLSLPQGQPCQSNLAWLVSQIEAGFLPDIMYNWVTDLNPEQWCKIWLVRPKKLTRHLLIGHSDGVLVASASQWSEHRSVSLTTQLDFASLQMHNIKRLN